MDEFNLLNNANMRRGREEILGLDQKGEGKKYKNLRIKNFSKHKNIKSFNLNFKGLKFQKKKRDQSGKIIITKNKKHLSTIMKFHQDNSSNATKANQIHGAQLDLLLDNFFESSKFSKKKQQHHPYHNNPQQSKSLIPLNRNFLNKCDSFANPTPSNIIQTSSSSQIKTLSPLLKNSQSSQSDNEQNIIELFKPKEKQSILVPIKTLNKDNNVKLSPKRNFNPVSVIHQRMHSLENKSKGEEGDSHNKLDLSLAKSSAPSSQKASSYSKKQEKEQGRVEKEPLGTEDQFLKFQESPSRYHKLQIGSISNQPAPCEKADSQFSMKQILNRFNQSVIIKDLHLKQENAFPQEQIPPSIKSQLTGLSSSIYKQIITQPSPSIYKETHVQKEQVDKPGFTLQKLSPKRNEYLEISKKVFQDSDSEEDLSEIELLLKISNQQINKSKEDKPHKELSSSSNNQNSIGILKENNKQQIQKESHKHSEINKSLKALQEEERIHIKKEVDQDEYQPNKDINKKRNRFQVKQEHEEEEEDGEEQQREEDIENQDKLSDEFEKSNEEQKINEIERNFSNFYFQKKQLPQKSKSQNDSTQIKSPKKKVCSEENKQTIQQKKKNEEEDDDDDLFEKNYLIKERMTVQNQIQMDSSSHNRLMQQYSFQSNPQLPAKSISLQSQQQKPVLNKFTIDNSICQTLKMTHPSSKRNQIVDSDQEMNHKNKNKINYEFEEENFENEGNFNQFIDDGPLYYDHSPEQMNVFSESNEEKKKQGKGVQSQIILPSMDENEQEKKIKKKLIKAAHIEDIDNFKCSICLDLPKEKYFGEIACHHRFCHSCILKWTKRSNQCPMCRQDFYQVLKRNFNGTVAKNKPITHVRKRKQKVDEEDYIEEAQAIQDEEDRRGQNDAPAVCYKCASSGSESLLLICDVCDENYCHTFCDEKIRTNRVPPGRWACHVCRY